MFPTHARPLAVFLLLGIGLSLPRRAVAADAGAEIQQAVETYEAFEYERALELFDALAKSPGVSPKQLGRVYLYRGLVLFSLMKREEADESFLQAIAHDPSVEPPVETSPKITSRFYAVRRRVLEASAVKKAVRDPKVPPVVPTPSPSSHTWTWIAASVAGVTVTGGVVSHLWAGSVADDFAHEPWADRAQALKNKYETITFTRNILFATAGAAAVSAIILGFVEGSPARERTTIGIAPGVISVQIRFD